MCVSDMHVVNMAKYGYTKYAVHLRLLVIMGYEFAGVRRNWKNVTQYTKGDFIVRLAWVQREMTSFHRC